MASMTGGQLIDPATAARKFTGVSIDSRTVKPGELFIALRGARTDGHDYIRQAIERGAGGILLEAKYPIETLPKDIALVTVPDSHAAMLSLARQHRHACAARFIGITGSNGKTTTKELTYDLLSAVETNVYRSPGNLNNLYGMPLAMFGIPNDTRIAVMEMGISTPGEMTRLVGVVEPDFAVITNVSATHLEFLGSLEGVARAKLEIVTASSPAMPVIINADDAILLNETRKHRKDFITYAVNKNAMYRPESVTHDSSGVTNVLIEGHRFRLPLFGQHQIYNLMAAYAVARTLGYRFDSVKTESIRFETAPMRGQTVTSRGVSFIVDCYNANPESVALGLTSLADVPVTGRRIIILGDMLELGEQSAKLHESIGALLAKEDFDYVALVGPMSSHTAASAKANGVPKKKIAEFDTARDCAQTMSGLLHEGDLVYVKGSRGIGLEVILQVWEQAGGKG